MLLSSLLLYYVYESLSNCSVLVSLGHLVMDLNHMLRPAKSPEKCTLQVLNQPPDKLVSLFEQKTVKGWWPCTCENNGEKIIAVRAQTHTQNHFPQGAKTYKPTALFFFAYLSHLTRFRLMKQILMSDQSKPSPCQMQENLKICVMQMPYSYLSNTGTEYFTGYWDEV